MGFKKIVSTVKSREQEKDIRTKEREKKTKQSPPQSLTNNIVASTVNTHQIWVANAQSMPQKPSENVTLLTRITTPALQGMPQATMEEALGNTMARLYSNKPNTIDEKSDSTATVCVVTHNEIHTSHVGLSGALVVNLTTSEFKRLNCAHDAKLPLQRANSTYFSTHDEGKAPQLMHARSHSLRSFNQMQATSTTTATEPDIYSYSYPNDATHTSNATNQSDNDDFVLLLYTNSIRDCIHEEELVEILVKNKNQLDQATQEINQLVYEYGYEGESNIMAIPFKKGSIKEGQALVVGLFEGHHQESSNNNSNTPVAPYLSDNFSNALQAEMIEKYSTQLFPDLSCTIESCTDQNLQKKLRALQEELTKEILTHELRAPGSLAATHPFKQLEKHTCKAVREFTQDKADRTDKIFAIKKYKHNSLDLSYWQTHRNVFICTLIGGIIGALIGMVIGAALTIEFSAVGSIPGAYEGALEGAAIGAAIGAALFGSNSKKVCRWSDKTYKYVKNKPYETLEPNIEDAIEECKTNTISNHKSLKAT
jgi:serine/threonine protein phosphatase PrpC